MQQGQSSPARRSRFFAIMSGLLLLFVFVGFARTLFLRAFFDVPAIPGYLYVHGIVLTAWFLLLFTQTCLIAKNRVKVHQRLGMAGVALAVCVVAISVWVLVRRDLPTIDERPDRSFPNLISVIVFTLCVGSAVWLRKKSAAHKRLMLIGSMIIIAPALDRMSLLPGLSKFIDAILPDALGPPEIVFATLGTLLLFLIVMIYDILTRKRPHWATIFGILCLFIIGPAISAAITMSGMWSAFVRWVG